MALPNIVPEDDTMDSYWCSIRMSLNIPLSSFKAMRKGGNAIFACLQYIAALSYLRQVHLVYVPSFVAFRHNEACMPSWRFCLQPELRSRKKYIFRPHIA